MSEYIEREAAIEAVCLCCGLHSVCEEDEYAMEGCFPRSNLNCVPAADVRPVKRGEWIDHQEGRWIYAKCSECGTVHDVKSNFCPSCGADMREEQS